MVGVRLAHVLTGALPEHCRVDTPTSGRPCGTGTGSAASCAASGRQIDHTPTWRDIWDDEDARGFVRSVNGGCETVPTVCVGTTVLTNPSGAQVARAAGVVGGRSAAEGLSSGRNRAALRLGSWLPAAALVVFSVVLDARGDVGLSWAVDPFAVAAWWFTRPLRR